MRKVRNIVKIINKGGQLIRETVINIDNVLFIKDTAINPFSPEERIYSIHLKNDEIIECSKEEYEKFKKILRR